MDALIMGLHPSLAASIGLEHLRAAGAASSPARSSSGGRSGAGDEESQPVAPWGSLMADMGSFMRAAAPPPAPGGPAGATRPAAPSSP